MLLSVITINLNNRKGLLNTLESLRDQDVKDFEIIVIDGGSTDGSLSVINENEKHITAWCSEPDNGIYNAMNKGVQLAKGEYLLFLNSADTLYDQCVLKDVIKLLNGYDILIGVTEYAENNGHVYYSEVAEKNCDLNLLIKASLPHQSSFIKRELLLPGYDENLKFASDWKFFLEQIVIHKCSVKRINRVVTKFDMFGLTSDPRNWDEMNNEKKAVLWQMLRYDFDDWIYIKKRMETADYYEKLWWMKLYFQFNNAINKLKLGKKQRK
jgi:glycosyltransferase involved in cell wall biosynthesis